LSGFCRGYAVGYGGGSLDGILDFHRVISPLVNRKQFNGNLLRKFRIRSSIYSTWGKNSL
jgi:hypothetical protein